MQKLPRGPQDINVAEVHDTVAPIELLLYEELACAGRANPANG